jgi:hypothetical protein
MKTEAWWRGKAELGTEHSIKTKSQVVNESKILGNKICLHFLSTWKLWGMANPKRVSGQNKRWGDYPLRFSQDQLVMPSVYCSHCMNIFTLIRCVYFPFRLVIELGFFMFFLSGMEFCVFFFPAGNFMFFRSG